MTHLPGIAWKQRHAYLYTLNLNCQYIQIKSALVILHICLEQWKGKGDAPRLTKLAHSHLAQKLKCSYLHTSLLHGNKVGHTFIPTYIPPSYMGVKNCHSPLPKEALEKRTGLHTLLSCLFVSTSLSLVGNLECLTCVKHGTGKRSTTHS